MNFRNIIVAAFFSAGILNAQKKINVYDTLIVQKQFSNFEYEKKENFNLTGEGILKRKVLLHADALLIRHDEEDSLFSFLKRAFPLDFKGLEYYAGESVNWKLENKEVFQWKKGKKIATDQLKKVFFTEFEVNHVFRRADFLQDEEDAHCFSFQYYVHDSAAKTIYGFNSLSETYEGKITYDSKRNIVYEAAYYPDRKTAMELKNGTFSVYASDGKKLYEHTAEEITAYSASGTVEWKYNTKTKKITGTANKQVGWNPEVDYITKLKAVWKEIYRS
jgi:hypothetical protein